MSKKLKFYKHNDHEGYDVYNFNDKFYFCLVNTPCITAAVLTLILDGILKRDKEVLREILE
jgi:hypothetical protein